MFFLSSFEAFWFFFNESVLTNCSDIPWSVGGFGAALQTGPEPRANDARMWSCLLFSVERRTFSQKKPNHQEAGEGRNQGEKGETPFSGSGWWPGELPAVGCSWCWVFEGKLGLNG